MRRTAARRTDKHPKILRRGVGLSAFACPCPTQLQLSLSSDPTPTGLKQINQTVSWAWSPDELSHRSPQNNALNIEFPNQHFQRRIACETNLPTLGQTPVVLEGLPWKTFSEIVSALNTRTDLEDLELSVAVVSPKPMVLDKHVTSAAGDAMGSCQDEAAVVVLEGAAANARDDLGRELQGGDDFEQQTFERKKGAKGCAERNILAFQSRETDLGLELRLPSKGAAAKHNNVSSSRADAVRIIVRFATIESAEVSVDVTIQLEFPSWSNDGALVLGASEVSDNRLDRSRMALLRRVRESRNLADSETDVRPRVGGQIKQHADDSALRPDPFREQASKPESSSGCSSAFPWRRGCVG
jgi:hypothetical protein